MFFKKRIKLFQLFFKALVLIYMLPRFDIYASNEIGEGERDCLCTYFSNCRIYLDLFRNITPTSFSVVNEFLKSKECEFDGEYSKICCAPLPDHLISVMNSDDPEQFSKIEYRNVIWMMEKYNVTKKDFETECNCKIVTHCNTYVSMVKNMGPEYKLAIFNYAKAQQCGFENGIIKVCCIHEDDPGYISAQATTTLEPDYESSYDDEYTEQVLDKMEIQQRENLIREYAKYFPDSADKFAEREREMGGHPWEFFKPVFYTRADALNYMFDVYDLDSMDLMLRRLDSSYNWTDFDDFV